MQRTTRTWVSPYLHPHLFECPTGEHAQRAPVGAQHGSSLFWTFRHHRDGPRKVVRTFSYLESGVLGKFPRQSLKGGKTHTGEYLVLYQ